MTAVRHKASADLTLSQIVRPTTMQFLHVHLLVFGCRQIIPRAQRVSVRFGSNFGLGHRQLRCQFYGLKHTGSR